MMQSISEIDWPDFSEAFPAFVTVVAMPLTFSIATGLSFGVITYTVVKLAAGKHREVSIVLWALTILFIIRDIYLAVG
jgi:adenine/guanine/hypoxanthine permease